MIRNAYTVSFFVWIVWIAICFNACKSKKSLPAENGFEALHTKFERLYIEACTQYNVGNYSSALSLFNKCADIKPEEASVYFQTSKIKQKLKDDNSAFQNASKANELAPANKYYAVYYADILRNTGNYSKAVQVLEISLKSNPKDENLYNNLDGIYEIINETDKRIALWISYKENAGFKTAVGMKLVALYKLKKDYQSAHAMYDELKKAAPNKTQFYIEDAKLYAQQKDTLNANRNYEKAIEGNPNNWDVNYALYQYYSSVNNTTKAIGYFKLAFEKSAVNFDVKLPACQQLLKQIKTDSSKCTFSEIASNALVKNYGLEANALYTGAELFYNCRHYKEALQNYEAASGLNPNLFDAWKGAMTCGIILGEYKQTIKTGELAIEYFPNTALLYEYLAKAANLDKQYDKAYEYAVSGERYIFDDEEKPKLYLQKAISLYRTGKYDDALKTIMSAIEINKTDPSLYNMLGNIYSYLKDDNKAVENWQRAKALGSKDPLIDKKIKERKVYE